MKITLDRKYIWTIHSKMKMGYYGLSESRIRRVIKTPTRIEEGIAEDTIALMQPSSYKTKGNKRTWNQEIWAMIQKKKDGVIKVISAWRYPGVTKNRGELPEEILNEIKQAINNL